MSLKDVWIFLIRWNRKRLRQTVEVAFVFEFFVTHKTFPSFLRGDHHPSRFEKLSNLFKITREHFSLKLVMALFDVSDFKRYSELRRQILPSDQTHLKDRTTHYTFGLKKQELAVPLGVDVSILVFHVNIYRGFNHL